MDTKTTHGIRPERLIDLLSVGLQSSVSGIDELVSDEQIRDYFSDLVHRKIPNDSSIIDSILLLLRENKRYGKLVGGRSLCELLLDGGTDLQLHVAIKDYSKKIYQSSISKGENSIAAAIYYLAIAAALVYHDATISAHSKDTLKTAFGDLLAKTWMSPEFKELLETARTRCVI